jgi:hypothetical protein
MVRRVHRLVGLFALTLIVLFFVSTIAVEVIGDHRAVAAVKTLILIGVCVLVPSMAAAGVTGRLRARNRRGPIVRGKLIRTGVIAAIGLLVLVPCAVTLQRLSAAGDFGGPFRVVQAIELLGGAVNIVLMSLNVRAGMIMTGRIRRRSGRTPTLVSDSTAV